MVEMHKHAHNLGAKVATAMDNVFVFFVKRDSVSVSVGDSDSDIDR